MKRRMFNVAVYDGSSRIAETVTYAHNSGVRATERLVRELARETGEGYVGGKPSREENGDYFRAWSGVESDRTLVATVKEVQ